MLLEVFEEFRDRGLKVIHFKVDFLPLNVEYPDSDEVDVSQSAPTVEDPITQSEPETPLHTQLLLGQPELESILTPQPQLEPTHTPHLFLELTPTPQLEPTPTPQAQHEPTPTFTPQHELTPTPHPQLKPTPTP